MLVPAVAHAEKLLDLKQEYKEKYDEEVIIQGLARKGLEIFPFETRHALRTATLLGTAFPNTEDWRRAKMDMCLKCLGIAHKVEAIGIELGPGKSCGATIDWLIAAQAVEEGHVLVTDDRGIEFKQVSDKVRLKTLEQAIGELIKDAEGPAQGSDAH